MSNFSLSFSDLLLVDGFAEQYGAGGNEAVLSFLYASGMDVSQPIEAIEIQHRNLRNQVVKCIRYCGTERTDKAWIRSGAASLDAIIASSDDKDLRRELKEMSKEVPFDQAFNGPFHENLGE